MLEKSPVKARGRFLFATQITLFIGKFSYYIAKDKTSGEYHETFPMVVHFP